MRQRSRLVVLALAALVGLASCTGSPANEEPTAVQSLESSPSSPASEVEVSEPEEPEGDVPTPEPLPLPEYPEDLTAEDTAENAILAAEYFLDLMNYIQSSGDVAPLEEVAAQSCASCERYIEKIGNFYRDGSFSVGNHIEMEKPFALRTKDGSAWEVVSDWKVTDGFQYETELDEVKEVSGTTFEKHRVGVQLIDGQWHMLTFAKASDT